MTLTELKSKTRRLIYDTVTPYRHTETVLVDWLNLGLNDLRTKRPDARFNAGQNDINDNYVTIDDLYNFYSYTDSSGYNYLADMQNITGWVKATYPVLYMKASSATNINIFPTTLDRTNTTNLMAHIASAGTAGTKTVTFDGVLTFAGTVTLNKAVVSGTIWNITTATALVPADDTFQEPLMYYIASKVYESDSDDTQNAGLSDKYYAKYLQGIKS